MLHHYMYGTEVFERATPPSRDASKLVSMEHFVGVSVFTGGPSRSISPTPLWAVSSHSEWCFDQRPIVLSHYNVVAIIVVINGVPTGIWYRPTLLKNSRHPCFASRSADSKSIKIARRAVPRHRFTSGRISRVTLFYRWCCLHTFYFTDFPDL